MADLEKVTKIVKVTKQQMDDLKAGRSILGHTYDPIHCLYQVDDGLEMPTTDGKYLLTVSNNGQEYEYTYEKTSVENFVDVYTAWVENPSDPNIQTRDNIVITNVIADTSNSDKIILNGSQVTDTTTWNTEAGTQETEETYNGEYVCTYNLPKIYSSNGINNATFIVAKDNSTLIDLTHWSVKQGWGKSAYYVSHNVSFDHNAFKYNITSTRGRDKPVHATISLPTKSGTIVVEDTPKIYNQLKVWPELPKNWGEQFIELHGKPNSTTSLKVTSKRTQELSKDDFLNNTFMKIPTSGTFYWAYHNKKTRGSDFPYDGLFRPHQSVGAPIADPDLTNLVMARKKYTNEINKTTLTYGDFIAELLGEDFANYIDSTQSIQFTRVASNGSASKNDSGGYKYYNALNKSDHLYISIPIQVNKVSEIIDCFQQSHICFNRKCQRSAANKSALINNFNAGTNSRICRGAALLDIVKCEVTAQPQYTQYIPKHVLAHLNVADIYFQRVYKYINYNNEVITVNRPQVIIRIDKKLFSEQYSD